jgi:hypothetical protein
MVYASDTVSDTDSSHRLTGLYGLRILYAQKNSYVMNNPSTDTDFGFWNSDIQWSLARCDPSHRAANTALV